MIFDFVQHQAVSLLDVAQLFKLVWSSPGAGRDGLHTLAIVHGPTSPHGGGLRAKFGLSATPVQATPGSGANYA